MRSPSRIAAESAEPAVGPAWLAWVSGPVRRHGVLATTAVASLGAVGSSTAICHAIYWLFGVTPTTLGFVLPTVAPALVAPPMVYLMVRTIEVLGEAEESLRRQRGHLRTAVRTAQEQALKAESAARARTRFLAHMSHELRTPLNAIIGFSETIRDEHLGPVGTPAYRRYASDIGDSGNKLLALVNDILDITRIQSGRLELECAWHDARALVGECAALMRPAAAAKGVTLEFEADGPDLRVYGDGHAIRQVLLNVLSNAVRFTNRAGRVEIAAGAADGGGLRFVVSDTGVGFTAVEAETVLEPFGRLDHDEAGAGLGLPLARGLVELHGGSLTLDSEPGRGTHAAVWFPDEGERVEVAAE